MKRPTPLRGVLLLLWLSSYIVAQTDLVAAEAEVTAILADLSASIGSFERPPQTGIGVPDFETSMQQLTAVAARIDLFEPRFGVKPEEIRGWTVVQSEARKALDPRRVGVEIGNAYFAVSSSAMGKAILHEIAGDLDAALEILAGIKAGGGCGNWIATVNLSVNTRRSAILEKKGQFKDALAAHERALGSIRYALHSKNLPALYLRYAILLEGNDLSAKAFAQYQRVVDLFPRTPADAIARARLTTAKKLVIPTADRLRIYRESDDRTLAILALGGHRFPESLEILIALIQAPDKNERVEDKVIQAIGDLGDPKAIPFLQSRVANSELHLMPLLLIALDSLGDTSQVLVGLERIKGSDWIVGAEELQEMLLRSHPEGPRLSRSEALRRTSRFANEWIEYLNAHGSSTRPESRLSR